MKIKLILLALLLSGVGACSSAFTVGEGTQVIVTQFGKPIGEPIVDAGLHFKLPFIQDVRVFERRVLEWDGDPNQIPTLDKKFIEIDTTARWRIVDLLLFQRTVINERGAQGRLDDILDSETRDAISSHNLIEAVRTTNREMAMDEDLQELATSTGEGALDSARAGQEDIDIGRGGLVREIFDSSQVEVAAYGIELVDFRIKQINYVEEVQRKVYDRMVSERRKIAERYRAEGQGESSEITGQREKELSRIRSEAYRRQEEILGESEAAAARLYAEAYEQDAEFFAFTESLRAYKEMLDSETTLVLSLESDLMRYLSGSGGEAEQE